MQCTDLLLRFLLPPSTRSILLPRKAGLFVMIIIAIVWINRRACCLQQGCVGAHEKEVGAEGDWMREDDAEEGKQASPSVAGW